MLNRGKLVILAMIGIALVAAGFSTWYHYRNQHRALDFWGTTTAVLINEAPEVQAIELGEAMPAAPADDSGADQGPAPPQPSGDQDESVEFAGQSWPVMRAKDALHAPGMTNVRRALVVDTTYDWNSPPGSDAPNWQYALEFNDGRNWATVLFDFDSRSVALTNRRRIAVVEPSANKELRAFFAEQFPRASSEQEPDKAADEK